VNSKQLAKEVRAVVKECEKRILGIGHEQYGRTDPQKFETIQLSDLLAMALEELQDVVVYATMLTIRIKRLQFLFLQMPGVVHEPTKLTEPIISSPEGVAQRAALAASSVARKPCKARNPAKLTVTKS